MENIYNFVSKPEAEREKPARYKSKFDPKAPLTGSTFGLHGTTVTLFPLVVDPPPPPISANKTCVVSSTFGPPRKTVSSPKNFLRKGSSKPGIKVQVQGGKCNDREKRALKPPVTHRNEKPVMGLKTSKNFITANAVQAILTAPRKVNEENVPFIEKENYGCVPEYLSKVKEEIARENDIVDRYVKQQMDEGKEPAPEYEQMDEDERRELIDQLKRKWDSVNSKYQKICHRVTIETTGDIKRKEAQEAELKQLEDDIEKLSKPGPVLIRRACHVSVS